MILCTLYSPLYTPLYNPLPRCIEDKRWKFQKMNFYANLEYKPALNINCTATQMLWRLIEKTFRPGAGRCFYGVKTSKHTSTLTPSPHNRVTVTKSNNTIPSEWPLSTVLAIVLLENQLSANPNQKPDGNLTYFILLPILFNLKYRKRILKNQNSM